MPDPTALEAYDFDLPDGQIAQRPAERRDGSRMLVLNRATGQVEHRQFSDLEEYLETGDAIVFNDTRVVPARLVGNRPTGGKAELFLIDRHADGTWTALARPGRKLQPGARVLLSAGLEAEILALEDNGRRRIRLTQEGNALDLEAEGSVLDEVGRMPLPPYVDRDADATDRERYQTVFARARGAVAAPTAGLHFTEAVLESLRHRGLEVEHVTLHVGYGTFEPVRADDLRDHRVAAERVTVTPDTVDVLNRVRDKGGRIVAVGTTSTRALETSADLEGRFQALDRPTDLTVTPGYRFRGVDVLLTNFHLPSSSLLVLTATFGGLEAVMGAYREAVLEGYRFYSYGDCMLIV